MTAKSHKHQLSNLRRSKTPKRGWRQGLFTPRNPEKYKGDITKIWYMSSWELEMNRWLDNNINVLEWSSEEVVVPYIKPTDGKIHKYYVDYWVKFKNKKGEEVEELWELKPHKQTVPPTTRGKRKKQQLVESVNYAINLAKWKYAQAFCKKNGWKFRIISERDMFK